MRNFVARWLLALSVVCFGLATKVVADPVYYRQPITMGLTDKIGASQYLWSYERSMLPTRPAFAWHPTGDKSVAYDNVGNAWSGRSACRDLNQDLINKKLDFGEILTTNADARAPQGSNLFMFVNANNEADMGPVQFNAPIKIISLCVAYGSVSDVLSQYYKEPTFGRPWAVSPTCRWEDVPFDAALIGRAPQKAPFYGEVFIARPESPLAQATNNTVFMLTGGSGQFNTGVKFVITTQSDAKFADGGAIKGAKLWWYSGGSRWGDQNAHRELLVGSRLVVDGRPNDNSGLMSQIAMRTAQNAGVYGEIAAKFQSFINLPGGLEGSYTFWMPFSGSKVFQAKIPNDLHVFLNRTNTQIGVRGQVTNGFEFVLGGWSNQASCIRKGSQGAELFPHAPNNKNNGIKIPNPGQMNTYWVSANAGTKVLSLGAGSVIGQNVLIQVTTTEDISNLAWLSFSTWDQPGVYGPAVDMTKAVAQTAQITPLVAQAFLAMGGPAANNDNGGSYWIAQALTQVANGMNINDVPAWLMKQLATASWYGDKVAAQVDKAAQDVLGHVFNADGRNYWVKQVISQVQGGKNINDVPAWLTDQFKASDEYKAKVVAAKAALEKAMLAQAGTSAISIPATKIGGGGFIFSEQWKAKPADGYVVTFQGRGLNDLFVILATKPAKMDYRPFTAHGVAGESYEIDFGAWGNHRHLLLKNGQYVRQAFAYPADDAAAAKVNDIITTASLITGGRDLGDGTTWDWYWVKYLHGRLSMGKGQNPDDAKSEIMAWQDPAPLAFKDGVYVGFGNYNSADVEFKDIKISSLTWQAPKDYEASLDDATKQVVWAKEFTVGSRGGQFWAFYVDPMTESSIYQYQIGSMSDNPWALWLKDPKDVNGAAVGKIDSVVVTSDGAMAILSQAGIVYTVDVDKKALTALPMVDDQGVKIELAEQISYGNSKNLWMFDDKSDVIYQFNFDKKVWEARCPAGAASQIAVGLDGETWGLASDGTPARYKGNNQWERKAGQKLNFIAVGSQGAIYGVSQSNLYTYKDGAFVADPTVTGIRQIATNATGQSTIINTIDFMLGVKGKSGVAFAAPTATPPAAQISGGMSGLADILVKSGGKLLDAATQTLFQKGLADLFANVQKESADSKAAYVAFLKTYADNTMFDATTKALMKKQLADATLAPAVAAVAKATAPATTPPLSAEEQKKAADAAQAAADAAKAKVAAATTTADKVAAVAAQKVADQAVAAVKSSTVKVTATAAAKTTKAAVSLTKAKTTAATAAKTDAKAAAAAKTVAAAKTATATKVAAKVTKTTAKATAAAKASTPATKTATTAKAATKTAATATTTAAKTATATTKTAATTAKTAAKTATAAKTTTTTAVKKATKSAAKK